MQYKNLHNHSLFVSHEGIVARKHSNAFSVNLQTGKEFIPALNDVVQPINKEQASAATGLDMRYL